MPMTLPLLLLVACLSATDDDPATACNEANEACESSNCGVGDATMLPGASCVGCHSEGSPNDQSGRRTAGADTASVPTEDTGFRDGQYPRDAAHTNILFFSVAGTVFADADGTGLVAGAVVRVTDATGTTEEMVTNSSGNFFTQADLVFPLAAEIEHGGRKKAMSEPLRSGDCNSCHACAGAAGGKLTPG